MGSVKFWVFATLCAASFVAVPTTANDVRGASNEEMREALIGCWRREADFTERRFEQAGYFNHHTICFDQNGIITMSSVGGDEHGVEGLGASGLFEVSQGRLRLVGVLEDGWLFDNSILDCDVLMSPGHAFKLLKCIGTGENFNRSEMSPVALTDSSYERLNP